ARENAEHGFIASDALSKNLQTVLVDFIALSLTAKQAHWNIVGTNFRDLHLNLDEVTDIARAGSDEIAERMRALQASPDGRAAVGPPDPTTADICHDDSAQVEQQAWFISAETRVPK